MVPGVSGSFWSYQKVESRVFIYCLCKHLHMFPDVQAVESLRRGGENDNMQTGRPTRPTRVCCLNCSVCNDVWVRVMFTSLEEITNPFPSCMWKVFLNGFIGIITYIPNIWYWIIVLVVAWCNLQTVGGCKFSFYLVPTITDLGWYYEYMSFISR